MSFPFAMQNDNAIWEAISIDEGYGVNLCLADELKRSVAFSTTPLTVMYREGESASRADFSFDETERILGGMVCHAAFTDQSQNMWRVRMEVRSNSFGGFSGKIVWKLEQGNAQGVFLGHNLRLMAEQDDIYVCYPGSVYDGNAYNDCVKTIPRLQASNGYTLHTPVASLSAPAGCFYIKSSGKLLTFGTTQRAQGHPTGYIYEKETEGSPYSRVTAIAPCYRNKRYKLDKYDGVFRHGFMKHIEPGATVKEGEEFIQEVSWFPTACSSVADFYGKFHGLRDYFKEGASHKPVLPIREAAKYAEENMNKTHWTHNIYYANAVQVDGTPEDERQLVTGWCSGSILAYGLSLNGDEETRRRCITMMDFMADTGISPSGLFYSFYENNEWQIGKPVVDVDNDAPYGHIRNPEDCTFFFEKYYLREKANGREHENWKRAIESNLNTMVRLWKEYGEFGFYIDLKSGEMEQRGTAAGALCIACLAKGHEIFDNEEYLRVAVEASDSYYARFIETGHVNGGPLDILRASDSESNSMFMESFVCVYERTQEKRFLRYALDATDQMASWCMAYNAELPKDSTLGKLEIETLGGIIANAQNHHIGPAAATTSLSYWLRLYDYTGEERVLRLLEDATMCLPQYVSQYDEHIGKLKKGMMTEQINLTDSLNKPGELWNVSVAWSVCNVLLVAGELPGVYINTYRKTVGVFDQLLVDADFAAGKATIKNTTPFTAEFDIMTDGERTPHILTPGEALEWAF